MAITTERPFRWHSRNEIGCPWEWAGFVDELFVPSRSGGHGRGALVTQEFDDQAITSHPDETMDGIHGRPLASISERSGPGQCVEVVGVEQCSINIEQNSGP